MPILFFARCLSVNLVLNSHVHADQLLKLKASWCLPGGICSSVQGKEKSLFKRQGELVISDESEKGKEGEMKGWRERGMENEILSTSGVCK